MFGLIEKLSLLENDIWNEWHYTNLVFLQRYLKSCFQVDKKIFKFLVFYLPKGMQNMCLCEDKTSLNWSWRDKRQYLIGLIFRLIYKGKSMFRSKAIQNFTKLNFTIIFSFFYFFRVFFFILRILVLNSHVCIKLFYFYSQFIFNVLLSLNDFPI